MQIIYFLKKIAYWKLDPAAGQHSLRACPDPETLSVSSQDILLWSVLIYPNSSLSVLVVTNGITIINSPVFFLSFTNKLKHAVEDVPQVVGGPAVFVGSSMLEASARF